MECFLFFKETFGFFILCDAPQSPLRWKRSYEPRFAGEGHGWSPGLGLGKEALSIHASSWSTNLPCGRCFRKTRKSEWIVNIQCQRQGKPWGQTLGLAVCPRSSLMPCLKVGAEAGAVGQGQWGRLWPWKSCCSSRLGEDKVRREGSVQACELVVKTRVSWAWPPVGRGGLLRSDLL